MTPNLTRLISDILHLPQDAMVYEASRRLHDLYPDKFILETEDYDFDLASYSAAGKCMIHPLDDAFGHFDAVWKSPQSSVAFEPKNGLFEILWRGKKLLCLTISYDCYDRTFIISDSRYDAIEFFKAVCSLAVDASGEILVFRGGHWHRDAHLRQQIASASLDAVIMPDAMKSDLIRDVETFFASRELYEKHGLAWKRGLLLLGKPGNGKTMTIKALVNRLGVPCLYVRSLKSERLSEDRCISKVFAKAREVAPCVLVMEDLDSLVDEDNLSALLNELDGFASNLGVLTVATTNHPEDLDPALLNRPSRFDRKIEFVDPAEPERLRFLSALNLKREEEMQASVFDLSEAASLTEGFSYAFLQELNLCSMTAALVGNLSPAEALLQSVKALRTQVSGAAEQKKEKKVKKPKRVA